MMELGTAQLRSAPISWLRLGVGVLVVVSVVCALLAQHPSDPQQVPAWVVVVSLTAITASAIALPTPIKHDALRAEATQEKIGPIIRYGAVLLLPAVVAALIWNGEHFRITHTFTSQASTLGALFWLGGIVAALGLAWRNGALLRRAAASDQARGRVPAPLVLEAIAILCIVAVAALLRTWHIGTLPEGIFIDEADNALGTSRLLNMPFQPLSPGNIDVLPCLYYYVMAPLMRIGGNTIEVVRLTSALFGVLSVIGVYLLGRRVGGPTAGLCAAALLAMAQWSIDFSRFGVTQITAPAMTAVSFAALAVAMTRPRAFWFMLSGVLLGFTLLTYYGSFLPGMAVASIVVALRLLADSRYRRAAFPGVLLLPVGFVAGVMPLLIAIHLDAQFTLGRFQTASLFGQYPDWAHRLAGLQANLHAHLLMFTIYGDRNGRHNLPGAPMLDAVTGACLLLGLGICVRRIHRWYYQVLLLWLITTVMSGVLSLDFEAPQGARSIGAIAPIALIAALPLTLLGHTVWHVVLSAFARRAAGASPPQRGVEHAQSLASLVAATVLSIPLGVALAHNTNQYFVRQATDLSSWQAWSGQDAIIGRTAATLTRQGLTVRVDPSFLGDPSMVYAAGGLSPDAYDSGVPVPLPLPRGGLALIVPIDKTELFDMVHGAYPQARVIPLTPDFAGGSAQANVVIITPADVARNVGVTAVFGRGVGAIARAHLQGAIPWPDGRGGPTTAAIHATLLISSAEAWQPLSYRVIGAHSASVSIDGETWRLSHGATPPLRLGAGNHALTVTASGRVGAAIALQWTAPSGMGAGRLWSMLPAVALQAPTLPTGGLLGLYNPGPSITTVPTLARIDQSVNAYYQNPPPTTQFPFSARWMGTLSIARGGTYAFGLESVGPSSLFIDGARVTASGPDLGQRIGTIALRQGQHSIRVEYNATGSYLHCYLTWAPPGQPFAPIPPSATRPYVGR